MDISKDGNIDGEWGGLQSGTAATNRPSLRLLPALIDECGKGGGREGFGAVLRSWGRVTGETPPPTGWTPASLAYPKVTSRQGDPSKCSVQVFFYPPSNILLRAAETFGMASYASDISLYCF